MEIGNTLFLPRDLQRNDYLDHAQYAIGSLTYLPYIEGLQQIITGIQGSPFFKDPGPQDLPTPCIRASRFTLGLLLLVPVVNTVIFIALHFFQNTGPRNSKQVELNQILEEWDPEGFLEPEVKYLKRQFQRCFKNQETALNLSLRRQGGNAIFLHDPDCNAQDKLRKPDPQLQLTTLPDCFHLLPQIETINLSGHRLEELPPSIGALRNLGKLDLSRQQITTLPNEISQCENLSELNLDGNPLENGLLPDCVLEITSLRILSVNSTGLRRIPNDINRLSNLRVFNAEGNSLRSIPRALTYLSYLEELRLSQNASENPGQGIQMLPALIGGLRDLKVLTLANHQIKKLPESFGSLLSLRYLVLTNNRLEELPPSFYSIECTEIYLSHNPLLSVDARLFNHHINVLGLNHTLISELPSVGQAFSLARLFLQNNPNLRSLTDDLGALQQLEELNISGNPQLRNLPPSFLNLRQLNILTYEPAKAAALQNYRLRAFVKNLL